MSLEDTDENQMNALNLAMKNSMENSVILRWKYCAALRGKKKPNENNKKIIAKRC